MSGNVGIGTVSPDSSLEINGTGSQQLKITSTDHTSSAIILERTGNDYTDYKMIDVGGSLYFKNSYDDGLSWTTRMMIEDDSGNIGIGTTTPQNKLNVIGDANVTANANFGQNVTVANCIVFASGGKICSGS